MLRGLARATPGPGPASALFRARLAAAARLSTTPATPAKARERKAEDAGGRAEKTERNDAPGSAPRDLSREVLRTRRRAARGGAPWREMNEHDMARAGNVARAEAAAARQAAQRIKDREAHLAGVLASYCNTLPEDEPPDGVFLAHEHIDDLVDDMCDALDALDIRGFAEAWLEMMGARAYFDLSEDKWDALNRRFSAGLRATEDERFIAPLHGHVADLFHGHADLFHAVCHFAVEAAARHHHQSLVDVLLELMRFDHASIAKSLFEAYVSRGIVVNGVDRSLAMSDERAERVAARFASPGLRPLLLTYVAALTMLGKFDSTANPTFMRLTTDLWKAVPRQVDIYEVVRRLYPKLHPATYRANCDKMLLLYFSHHPSMFVVHIRALSRIGDMAELDRTYQRVLNASIGSDRLLTPVVKSFRSVTVAPLPIETWAAFATAYAEHGRPEVIIRMVEEEIPARYGTVPPELLQMAMETLAFAALILPDLAQRLMGYIDTLWDRLVSMGGGRSAPEVYIRLTQLNRLSTVNGFQATAAALRQTLVAASDPRANLVVDSQLIEFHMRVRQPDQALRILNHLDFVQAGDLLAAKIAHDLLGTVCTAPYPYATRRKFVAIAMRRIDPEVLRSAWPTSVLLVFLLGGGNNPEAACAALVQNDQKIFYYMNLIRRLAKPRRRGAELRPIDLHAALHILETYVPTHTLISGGAYTSTWNIVIHALAASPLPEPERAALIRRALACFPDTCQTHDRHLLALLRTVVVASLTRADPSPSLAHSAWTELAARGGGMWHRVELDAAVRGFLAAGMADAAAEVVRAACRATSRHPVLRGILNARAEWTTPEFEDALREAGVTDADGSVAVKIPGSSAPGEHRYSWESFEAEAEAEESEDGEAEEAEGEEMGGAGELDELHDVD